MPYIYIHILKLKEDFFVKWAKNFLPFVDLTSLKRKSWDTVLFLKSLRTNLSHKGGNEDWIVFPLQSFECLIN